MLAASILSLPSGPLSDVMPSSSIKATNKEVISQEILSQNDAEGNSTWNFPSDYSRPYTLVLMVATYHGDKFGFDVKYFQMHNCNHVIDRFWALKPANLKNLFVKVFPRTYHWKIIPPKYLAIQYAFSSILVIQTLYKMKSI